MPTAAAGSPMTSPAASQENGWQEEKYQRCKSQHRKGQRGTVLLLPTQPRVGRLLKNPQQSSFPGVPMLPEMSTRSRSSTVRPSTSSWMATAPFRASGSGRLFLAPSMTWILLCGFRSISLVRQERQGHH